MTVVVYVVVVVALSLSPSFHCSAMLRNLARRTFSRGVHVFFASIAHTFFVQQVDQKKIMHARFGGVSHASPHVPHWLCSDDTTAAVRT